MIETVPGLGVAPAATHSFVVLGLVAAVAVVAGGELFATGVEWLAERFDLGERVAGSVLAAVATTAPEVLIPVIAILRGSGATVATGAILGGPITLTTLGLGALGATALVTRGGTGSDAMIDVDAGQTRLDLGVFLAGFALATLVGLVAAPFASTAVGLVLFALYAGYLSRVRSGDDGGDDVVPEPLELGSLVDRTLGRSDPGESALATAPPTWLVVGQAVAALALLVWGSELFVSAITAAAVGEPGVPALLAALLLAPLIGNVPEYVEGVIWVARGKDALAMEQLTGTLAFYGTVLVGIGVAFTPWTLSLGRDPVDLLVATAVATALLTTVALYHRIRARGPALAPRFLLGLGVSYALYVALAVTFALADGV